MLAKAFTENGESSYSTVIRALNRLGSHKDTYKVRVLNLSFSATPRSHDWGDPLNLAVMRASQAGIVVVASAGDLGPDPMTIGVPGNVPHVITVGATSDNCAPTEGQDDYLTTFSSVGPTHEGEEDCGWSGDHTTDAVLCSGAVLWSDAVLWSGGLTETVWVDQE